MIKLFHYESSKATFGVLGYSRCKFNEIFTSLLTARSFRLSKFCLYLKILFFKLGQQIRFLFHYLEEEFEEKHYHLTPQFTKDAWYAERDTLGLPFPNVRFGDVICGQTT